MAGIMQPASGCAKNEGTGMCVLPPSPTVTCIIILCYYYMIEPMYIISCQIDITGSLQKNDFFLNVQYY